MTVTYPGNETYNATNTTVPINVEPRESTTDANIINSTAGNVTVEVNVTDTSTGEPVQNGTVNVYVNDTLVGSGEVVNGSVTIPTNITDVGPGEINITYMGNDEYNPSSEIEDVEIEPREVTLVVEEGNNTVGNTTVDIELTDATTGEPITDAPIEIINNGTVIATGTTD
ncbi:MAG: hypothetical protein E7Z84_03690, partial [Methanosphaera stadtmanae]|nr:hypothetical protein [Methanosphaera stadtmanae]